MLSSVNAGRDATLAELHVVNFSRWKRPLVAQCFPRSRLRFVAGLSEVPDRACALVWGMHDAPDGAARGIRLLRAEDGFLRSVGLGVDLIRPLSWVIDTRAMHYDGSRVSDLEHLLMHATFEPALIERAQALRARLVATGLTKYNTGCSGWERPPGKARVVLVPGQVETDASIRYGATSVRTNLQLLQAVRLANPQAWLIYKPHPDVLAGMRKAGVGEREAQRLCDECLADTDMGALLAGVDEVHVMTSLAGFEALLRGKQVVCHGQPFYAGWGLTQDLAPLPRRSRRLALDELVAGVLIRYPVYFSRDGARCIEPEAALDALLQWRDECGGRGGLWRWISRIFLRRVVGVR